MKERQTAHQATITKTCANRIEWESSDGRAGFILRDGKRVVLLETDDRKALQTAESCVSDITFSEPPEDAIRAAANNPVRRFNPFWSWQKDGDYAVTRSLCGLCSRHDRNSVGARDSFLLGMLAESHRTTSFNKWELGGGLVTRHEFDGRRGVTKATLLPWGVLASHSSARLPQSPGNIITRTTVLWGFGGSVTMDGAHGRSVHVLPFGLLFRGTTRPGQFSIHILGTGLFRKEATNYSGSIARFRLFGIPLSTTQRSSLRDR